jgi:hypothetical protein
MFHMGRKKQPIIHGTSYMYSRGCRCDECRLTWNRRAKERRDHKIELYYKEHPDETRPVKRSVQCGTLTGYTRGCRCDPCTKARREYMRNLSDEDYQKLWEKQGGRCAICESLLDIKKACLDHNYVTGYNRGILCYSCNTGIGFFKDNAEVLLQASKYVSKNTNEFGNRNNR